MGITGVVLRHREVTRPLRQAHPLCLHVPRSLLAAPCVWCLVSGVRGHVAVQQSGQVGLGKQGESALLREAVYTALITGPGTDQH